MADIGAVRVIFGADIAQLQDGIKKATDALGTFGKAAGAIATGVGVEKAIERVFDAIVESVNKAIESADKLSKASQKFGIPIDNLQVLAHAAALSDVNLEELGGSVAKLSKNMIAAEGPTSDQAAAFKALGLSVNQLISLRPDQAFLKIADAISKYGDGTGKTAAVQAIFGKGAANLIPILNEGAAGIAGVSDRLGELAKISGVTASEAEHFKDNLKLLEIQQTNLTLKIIGDSGLLAALNQLTEAMLGGSKTATQLADIFSGKLGAALVEINKFVADINAGLAGFGAGGQTQSFIQSLQSIGTTTAKQAGEGMDKLVESVGNYEEAARKAAAAPLPFNPETNKQAEAFRKELEKLHAETLEASGVFGSQLAPGFLQAAAHLEALKGQVTLTGAEMGKLGPQAEQLNNEMLKLAGAKFFDQSINPFERFQREAAIADQGLQQLGFSSEQIAEINEKNAERAGVSWKNATSDMLNSAASAFAGLAQKNKEFAGIAKALAIAQATFNAYLAYTKALATYPPPFDIIGAGIALASGLAAVATIAATPFAKGGSFMVPGGISGTDNQLVPLALSSGERVDITPAGLAAGLGRAQEIRLSGVGPRDLFTGSMLRDLVDALNQGARDGYRLKFAER